MLRAQLMIRPDNRPLEEAPDVLNAVGVELSPDVFLFGMIDRLMVGVEVGNALVADPFIRHDHLCLGVGMLLDKLVQGLAVGSLDYLQTDLSPALDSPDDHSLASGATACFPRLVFAADPGFIYFHGPAKFMPPHLAHSLPDPMAEIPGGLVGDPEGSLHLIGRHSLLGFDHQVHGGEPLPKGKVSIMEDRPASRGELVAA